MSGLVSMYMIVGLVLAVFILLIFEIQVELSHYVSVSATVWNCTVANHPQLKEQAYMCVYISHLCIPQMYCFLKAQAPTAQNM